MGRVWPVARGPLVPRSGPSSAPREWLARSLLPMTCGSGFQEILASPSSTPHGPFRRERWRVRLSGWALSLAPVLHTEMWGPEIFLRHKQSQVDHVLPIQLPLKFCAFPVFEFRPLQVSDIYNSFWDMSLSWDLLLATLAWGGLCGTLSSVFLGALCSAERKQ